CAVLLRDVETVREHRQRVGVPRDQRLRRGRDGGDERRVLRQKVYLDDAEQESDRADERVEEKLYRGIQATLAAPDADEEVHRHKRDLEEEEEEEQVCRGEDAEHGCLQQKQKDVVFLLSLLDVLPRRERRNRPQKRRQEYEQHGDAVHAHLVASADDGHPLR